MIFLCYPKCSTCRKAKKWLAENDIPFSERNIKDEAPSLEELKLWYSQSGLPLKKFFNTSGTIYKSMNLKDTLPSMTEGEQLELLATDGMLVKRPILIWNERVLVGFNQQEWENLVKELR